MLLCFAFLGVARADEVTIGSLEGAENNSFLPMNSLYKYSYTQQIYTAEEIGMAGTINSITLWMYGNANLYEMPFDIYMVETDKDEFLLTTDWETVTADDIVYSGTVTVHNTEAEAFTFDLDTPFSYSGEGNLLIAFNNTTGQWKSGLYGKVFGAENDAVRAIYARQDSGAYDPYDPTFSAYGLTFQRNVIELDITPGSGATCEKPESIWVSNIGTRTAHVNWSGGSGTYNFEVRGGSFEDWSQLLTNTSATDSNLGDLAPATSYQVRVQCVCEGDATSGWKTTSFTTACETITSFPWTEDFESYDAGEFSDPCWINERIQGGEGGGTLSLFKVSTTTMGDNSTRKLQLPDMNIGTLTKLVLPEMDVPANYEFSIDIYRSSSTYNDNYPNEGIRVYASTDGEIEGATELAFIPRQYTVSNDVIPAESAIGWYTYELPIGMSGTCYIILRGESQYCTATYMDNLTVKIIPTCLKPTGLTVTANSVTAHNATISWTENGEANTWIVEYATDADFTEVLSETVEDTPTYTFQGLDPETTFYVRVKADCGDGTQSEYSKAVNFTTTIACPAPTNLVANPGNHSATLNWDGTSESYIVNYRTAAYAEGIFEEFNTSGVPSGWTRYSGLVDDVIAGEATLTSVTSYWNTTSNTFGQYNMKLNIYSNTVKHWLVTPEFNLSQNLSFDLALTDYNNEDPIESDTLQADDRFVVLIYVDDTWHILREWNNSGSEYVFNAISYTGENVTIDLSGYYGQNVKIAFYGESTSSTGSNAGDNDLHIDNVICGIPHNAGEWQTITVDETTATIPGLTPLTAYEAKVQGDCGELDGQSLESNIITFTTLEGCPVPQNVEVDDITYNSATVSWDGYNESYNVSYRTAAYVDGIIESFDVSGVPSGWTRYSGLVDEVLDGTGTLTTATGGWQTTNYALGQYNMKLNIYGASVKHWLVTTEFSVNQNLSFDIALTDYNNENPIEHDTLQADDRFIVLIYADDAWHILREWNNSGSQYVYNTISTTGEHVTIDLSDYYGQDVKIAFYGESTSSTDSNAGDNDLHIDNIICGNPYEAGEWETVDANESPVILSGLTPETDYEVMVKGLCDDTETEWSETVAFTTSSDSETFTKDILGYGDSENDYYYLIALPIDGGEEGVSVTTIDGMITDAFDLYYFDQSQENEWINYHPNTFNLVSGKGYLYASQEATTLTFTGRRIEGNEYEVKMIKTEDASWAGWNLVGNPFAETAYIRDGYEFYTLNEEGNQLIPSTSSSIQAMEGVFVVADQDQQPLTFTTETPDKTRKSLVLNLTKDNDLIDRAIVRFDESRTLPKLQLKKNSTKVYIPKNNNDYAVVCSEEIGEMPVNFKAEKNGSYNLSFNTEDVSFDYLHLIDNLTGADIDLLANPSYSFDAKTTDYTSRFKLVFATGNVSDDGDNFAFVSNGELILTGEGTLQVFDALGRNLLSTELSTANCQLPTANFPTGVYLLQLIKGDDVKTQKIVIP